MSTTELIVALGAAVAAGAVPLYKIYSDRNQAEDTTAASRAQAVDATGILTWAQINVELKDRLSRIQLDLDGIDEKYRERIRNLEDSHAERVRRLDKDYSEQLATLRTRANELERRIAEQDREIAGLYTRLGRAGPSA